ncbi:sensor histidine kinase [Aquabacterium sp. OR-4]|uniref:sensor histidine kinase n=1 Tax=Aquabacterium sp. OR-4 TaxID=2978127 RepID=UPI0028C6E2C1|nr:ATP-binding protein [Aquabacterium sp. OR-4]MDT7838194.1 ATP-binding protein [Aquabacterium sp. OR-4]
MRRFAAHGRLLLVMGLVLLVLAAVRLVEFRPLDGDETGLIAIESAWVFDASQPEQASRLSLPVRSLRARRDLVQLRAVSEFELAAPPPDVPWMLYVEDLHDGGRLKVNGSVVADLPVTDARTTVRQLHPSRFSLPPGLLRAGTNVIEREWAIHENMLLMPRMVVGEAASVNRVYAPRDIAYRVLPAISLVVSAVLALIMFSIYLGNRELSAYLWVALSGAGFCVVDLIFFVNAIPAGLFAYWRLALFVAGCALTLGSYYFLLEVSGVDAPRYRYWTVRLSVLLCAAYLIYHLWTGNTFEPVFSRAILLLSACFAPLPLVALVRRLMQQFQWRTAVLLLVVLTGIWVNLMDLSAINSSRSAAQSGYLLQLFALVWFSSIAAFLIADHSRSLAAQRAQSATMARELAAQKAELSRLHALERAAREAEAAALERSRIMQDMHDGLGSQLVSSLVMARSGALSSQQTYELLRSCIDDLRLAIDSSHGSDDSLLLALGNLRFRMQPRLKAAGIALQWETQALGDALPLRAQHQLPVLRIVQECLTNALKHAGAKTITLTASQTDTALSIRIEDDGQGYDVEAARARATGKGLNSMSKRARMLGGQLQIGSSGQGTAVRLLVPFDAPLD